jgi:DNA topoisomerase-1
MLPPLVDGEPLTLHGLFPEQHFTKPPPHFTEASLIKELERLGIGRPSTYAGIVRTIVDRAYVKRERKSLLSTELGRVVCDFLVAQFPDLFAVGFTAHREEDLDRIARGERAWVEVLGEFYGPFAAAVARAQTVAAAEPVTVSSGKSAALVVGQCPQCGGNLVERKGKHGPFWGCSRYPACRYTQKPKKAPYAVGGPVTACPGSPGDRKKPGF